MGQLFSRDPGHRNYRPHQGLDGLARARNHLAHCEKQNGRPKEVVVGPAIDEVAGEQTISSRGGPLVTRIAAPMSVFERLGWSGSSGVSAPFRKTSVPRSLLGFQANGTPPSLPTTARCPQLAEPFSLDPL